MSTPDINNLFLDALDGLAAGSLIPDLSADLAELVKSVQALGRSGSLTLRIVASPGAEPGQVAFVADKSIRPPRETHPPTVFFAAASGQLFRKDPNQPELL